jgi:ribonuclease HII
VRDSKQMTSAEREFWYQRIIHVASSIGLGHASAEEIDKLGILPCTKLAMKRAIEVLPHPPAHILLDHVSLENVDLPQTSITRRDCKGHAGSHDAGVACPIPKLSYGPPQGLCDRHPPGHC